MATSSTMMVAMTIVSGNLAGTVQASCILPVKASVATTDVWAMKGVMMAMIVTVLDAWLIALHPSMAGIVWVAVLPPSMCVMSSVVTPTSQPQRRVRMAMWTLTMVVTTVR